MSPFKSSIFNTGTSFTESPDERRNVSITNYVSIIFAVCIVSVIAHRFLVNLAPSWKTAVLIAECCLSFIPILLNRYGWTRLSRIWISWYASLVLLYNSCNHLIHSTTFDLTTFIGHRFFLVTFACIPFLIFSSSERKLFLVALIIPVLGITLYDPLLMSFGYAFAEAAIRDPAYAFTNFRVIMSFIVLASCIYFLKRAVERREIENEKLVLELNQSLDKEKELAAMKTRFASMVSHEFRTPLTTIRLSANQIRRHGSRLSAESIEGKIDAIVREVDHMTHLLEDILMIGKTQDAKLQVNLDTTNLEQFIDTLKKQIEEIHKKQNFTILVQMKLNNPIIKTDADLLRNIFVNLLANAIKFSPGRNKVYLTAHDSPNEIHFEIRDEGIGIPEGEFERIFLPFDRASNAVAIPGTGLGLSIVKKAIDILGGSIRIKSVIKEGTTMFVTLPKAG